MLKTPLIAALALALTACATSSPDVVQRGEAQRMSQVQDATVLSTRPVTIDGSQSGTGGLTGGVLGGIAGSSRSSGRESVAIGVVGAVAGAVIGNAVERAATKEDGVEILLQMRNGERRAIVQAKGNETFTPGEPVILVTTGAKTRVMRAPAVAPAGSTAPVGTPVPPKS
jgi:outer membrane lipoprotein SlyB